MSVIARVSVWVAVVAVAGLGVLTWISVHVPEGANRASEVLLWNTVMWLVFALGAFAVMRSPRRAAIGLILAGGLALQVVAMSTPPQTSTDYYRYAWDGEVQAAGVNPYRYVPVDPALETLRDDTWLWPPGRTCPEFGVPAGQACPVLNRPAVPTIYPPFAQLYFLAVELVSPRGSHGFPLQLIAGLTGVAVTGSILLIARARRSDPRRAVLWSWCPLVVLNLGNNAHLDGLSALLVVVSLGLIAAKPVLSRTRAIGAGITLGLAVATKLLPALLLPVVVKRRPFAIVLAAAATVAMLYLPHVLSLGSGVSGYLSGYIEEEKGGQFAVIKLFVSDQDWALRIGLILLVLLTLWAIWRSDPARPWLAGAAMVGGFFLITTPTYEWYALLLVPLVAMGAPARWLVLVFAMTLVFFEVAINWEFPPARGLLYLAAGTVVAALALGDYVGKLIEPVADRHETGSRPDAIEPSETEVAI